MFLITRRQVTTAGLATGLIGLPRAPGVAETAASPDPLPYVNPELRPFAKMLLEQAKTFPPFSTRNLPAIWQNMAGGFGAPPLAEHPMSSGRSR